LNPRGWTRRRAIGGGALLLLISGCAGLQKSRTPDSLQPWPERLAALQAMDRFELDGRVGASDGKTGFSAGLRWRQHAGTASIDLTAPLGVGAAHIEQSADALQLRTSQGEILDGDAAGSALSDALGFDPPLRSLSFWLRGASDPALPAAQTLNADQRLSHLEQGGWEVEFPDYMHVQQQWLPAHLSVTRGALRLRLVINSWRL
jgi:outer membrane lipoprotein LolB